MNSGPEGPAASGYAERVSLMKLSTLVLTLAVGLLAINGPVMAADPPSHIMTWGSQGYGTGDFNIPRAAAVDASGNVYVADRYNNRIQKFSNSGSFISSWNALNNPRGVCVDGNYVYVSDTSNNRIVKYTTSGSLVTSWGSYGTGASQLNLPMGLEVHNGVVYVADSSNHRIQRFSTSGAHLGSWGSFGTGNGQFYYPRDLAIDSQGKIYVIEVGNQRVQKLSNNGNYDSQWGGPGPMNQPYGIAIDGDDNVYVANTYLNRIDKFTKNGSFILMWGGQGSGDGQFRFPAGIAVDGSGNVFVVDTNNHRAQKFGPSTGGGQVGVGDFQNPVAHRLYPSSPNPFRMSTQIAFDLSEPAAVSLQVFDFKGRLVRTLHQNSGMQPGEFTLAWNGTDDSGRSMTPGMYFFRLQVGNRVSSQKVVLIQ
jgi:sugar lactone lactonase YvrE